MTTQTKIAWAASLVFILSIVGCSSSSDPEDIASVSVGGELSQMTAAGIDKQLSSAITADNVDSIRITQVRILVSRVKLYRSSEDTTTLGHSVKLNPFVIQADYTAPLKWSGAVPISAGSYDKLKFEFHRFSESERMQYISDAELKDFATPERYSAIIEGIVFTNGNAEVFTYRATPTANLLHKFSEPEIFSSGQTYILAFQFNPMEIFKKGNSIVDPRDPKNSNDIDNAIKTSIKILKRKI